MTTVSARARTAIAFAATDDGADWAFRGFLAVGIVALARVVRHQWFVLDDWALVITRSTVRHTLGWKDWLFYSQDGHWLTVPVLLFRAVQNAFGLDSYLPFVALAVVSHVLVVLLVRVLCRRSDASAWTTTLVCAVLLVFGAGFENIVFAVQVSYNLSMAAFLAQLILVDHDGPVDRRDYFGAAIALIGVMSSGFGPVFIVGVAVVLALRKRWAALAIAVVPQGLAYTWWYLAWQQNATTGVPKGSKLLVPEFVARGLAAAIHGMVVLPGLTGLALLAVLAIALWRGAGWRSQSILLALWITSLVMLTGIGFERIGFGAAYATASRYRYMTAMLLAPALALAVDQLVKVSVAARWAGRLVLSFAALVNVGWLFNNGSGFAIASQHQRENFELIVGSNLIDQADPNHIPDPLALDVTVRWLPWLVEQHAIVPRHPANQAEVDRARAALGLPANTP